MNTFKRLKTTVLALLDTYYKPSKGIISQFFSSAQNNDHSETSHNYYHHKNNYNHHGNHHSGVTVT